MGRKLAQQIDAAEGQTAKGLAGVRLRRLKVTNFRALDHFEMEFPSPKFPDEPDVFVFGSSNGLGKTSLLEACALLYLGRLRTHTDMRLPFAFGDPPARVEFLDLLVRAGHQKAAIEGEFEVGESPLQGHVEIDRDSRSAYSLMGVNLIDSWPTQIGDPGSVTSGFLRTLTGAASDPFVCPDLMYFHSYRKVREGNVELGKMVGSGNGGSARVGTVGAFKLAVLRSMMGQKGLLEGVEGAEAGQVVEKLNGLLEEYAAVSIAKLRPSADNTIELRVSAGAGKSYPFDGLSSGQKEIISTLFLIWLHTHDAPGIVLIDEPELHLNAEWQVGIVRTLAKLVPGNQLILATHSEDVFGSVEEDRRFMLRPAGGGTHD